jgi:FkbM family methyltransferase
MQDYFAQQRLLAGRPVQVIVDGGANAGNTVAVYTELFPEAQLYAFEAYQATFGELANRWAGHDRVNTFPLALGAMHERRELYLNEYDDTNSLLPRPSDARRYYAADNMPVGTTRVDVISLDEFAERYGITRINILKLDIQGGERDALLGAGSLLQEGRIDLIFSEVFFVPHYEQAALFHELTAQLDAFGYSVYTLSHLVFGHNGQLRFADALYVSPDIRRTVIDSYPNEP